MASRSMISTGAQSIGEEIQPSTTLSIPPSQAPDEASLRAMDKIGYRYPRGESYHDEP